MPLSAGALLAASMTQSPRKTVSRTVVRAGLGRCWLSGGPTAAEVAATEPVAAVAVASAGPATSQSAATASTTTVSTPPPVTKALCARGAATASVPARLPHATAASPRRSTSPGPCLGERVQAEEHRRRCARGVRECRAKRLLVPALHPAHSARHGVGGMAPRGMQALCTGSSRRDGGRWLGAGCFCGPLARGPSYSRAGRGSRRS